MSSSGIDTFSQRPAPVAIEPSVQDTRAQRSMVSFLGPIVAAFSVASLVSHLLAAVLGLPTANVAYRRIGPQTGGQVFCAGSSLLQFALSWEEISQRLGEGIENWGIGGSTPSEWEVFQRSATNSNCIIIGLSMYDLNENHLCDARANIVPLTSTVSDLHEGHSSWSFSKRVLAQYPLAYARLVFPTAGRSDAVLVGVRKEFREVFKMKSADDDRAIAGFLRKDAMLKFGESTDRVSDWDSARKLRRVSLMRSESHGDHDFDGPKSLAVQRMMTFARGRGRVIIVVLPVSPTYTKQFVTDEVQRKFDRAVGRAVAAAGRPTVMRLDTESSLLSDDNFEDLVHLNSAGRQLATASALKSLSSSPTE